MQRNRGFPPVNTALSLVKAIKNESYIRDVFLNEFKAKKKKDLELKVKVEDLRARWAEFKDRIEKAFLESSSEEKERLAAQVKEAEKELNERLKKTEDLTEGIVCLLGIYYLIKTYNNNSMELRHQIESLVTDINQYLDKGQISNYYLSLANSFNLIHDSYIKYLNRTIQCKKELIIEDKSEEDRILSSNRILEKDLEEAKRTLNSWEKNVVALKDLGTDDIYATSHLKICISHYVEIYSVLGPKDEPKTVLEQIERINYAFLHMKSIVQRLKKIKQPNF